MGGNLHRGHRYRGDVEGKENAAVIAAASWGSSRGAEVGSISKRITSAGGGDADDDDAGGGDGDDGDGDEP